MATGIVVRTIAPLLRDKYQDPAVVVCDEQGRFADFAPLRPSRRRQ